MTNQRSQPAITRNSDQNISEDHWLKQFEKSLQKGAVQSKTQPSIFEQINSIMNQPSKHSSVEAKVEDMKNRSGLTAYLDKVKHAESEPNLAKTAQDAALDSNQANKSKASKLPIVIQKVPNILKTIQNCIKDSKGNLSLPAIIERVRSIHQGDVSEAKDWEQDDLLYLVSKLNLEAKKTNPTSYEEFGNLGGRDTDLEIDPSNTDAFFALNPAKI
jgi:hypothetical protein